MSPTALNRAMPDAIALGAICAYQRYVSPYKGFRCAHRALHGGPSCSEFAKRVLLRSGLWHVHPIMRRRFAHCAAAAHVLSRRSILDKDRRGDEPANFRAEGGLCGRCGTGSTWLDVGCMEAADAACCFWT